MSDALSFGELLERARAGDQESARVLVLRYEPMIRRAIRFRLGRSRLVRLVDSMDVCQSVLASFFLRAAAGQYDIEKPEQLVKLLVAMARNKLALQARAQHRQRRDCRRTQSGGVDESLFVAADPSPSQQVAGQELLEQAQQLLSAEERQLVEMRKEGLPWDAIAQQMGSTPEAVRKKLTRGVNRVAHQLHLDEYDDE
jgi:RNA polymerase sigma-70 factor (ECF subfamily)